MSNIMLIDAPIKNSDGSINIKIMVNDTDFPNQHINLNVPYSWCDSELILMTNIKTYINNLIVDYKNQINTEIKINTAISILQSKLGEEVNLNKL